MTGLAYDALKRKALEEVAEVWSDLRDECSRQISELRV